MSQTQNRHADAAIEKVGVLATVGSVLAAFFGVQNSRNRARDFSRGSPFLFLGVARVLTAGFTLVLVAIVRIVMAQAGASG